MTVLVGSEAPVSLRLVVRRAEGSTVDFLTVTAATVRVRLPKIGQSPSEEYVYEDWAPVAVETVSESLVRLIYPFAADGVDLPRVGVYSLAIDLIVPGGVVPCGPCSFPVIDRY